MSHKKINARVQKWREMLASGLHKEEKLRSRVRKGIPSSIRMIVWPELVRMSQFRRKNKQIDFQKLCNKFSNNVSEIALDIPRTFPEEEDSKVLRRSMNNVLKAISIIHPKVGYCQGMNFLTLRLLQVLCDEDSFWLLHYILENDSTLNNNFVAPQEVEMNNYVLEKLLKIYAPSLLNYFQESQIQYTAFTVKWFLTIFSGTFKQELFNRYFEVYLTEGWSIVYAIAIALLKSSEQKLKKCNMEECMILLTKQGEQIQKIDQFMEFVYKFQITPGLVTSLQKQYHEKKAKNGKNLPISRRQPKKPKEFVPQQEFCSSLTFQSQNQEINFDALYLLKQSD